MIKKNLEQCRKNPDLSFDKLFDSDYSNPFFSIKYKRYKFVMYLYPDKMEECLHVRGIYNFFFKKKVVSIQKSQKKSLETALVAILNNYIFFIHMECLIKQLVGLLYKLLLI